MIRNYINTVFLAKGLAFFFPGVMGMIFYFLSQSIRGISFLMQLFSLVCVFWIVFFSTVLLSKRKGILQIPAKILKWLMIISVVILFVLFIIVEAHILSDHKGDSEIPPDVNTLIVLGCGIRGETPSLMLQYRLETALDWMRLHPESKAVLCGGQGPDEDIAEAECMRRWLVEHGIENERLLLESESESTRENIENAIYILKQLYPDTREVVVVSTGFHLFRSKKLCHFTGCKAYGLAGKLPEIPLFSLNYYCREFASVLFMYASEIFA